MTASPSASMAALAAHAPPLLTRSLARFELALNAAIGFAWGPLLFHFVCHIADGLSLVGWVALVVATVGLGWLASRAPSTYFRLRPWELRGKGHVYARVLGLRAFRRVMSHGDLMNAWLRRRVPDYRAVPARRAAVLEYVAETRRIERAHLVWGVGALPILAYALGTASYGFAALWGLVNTVTNAWPILLQRYNRARAERASVGRSAAT